MSSPSQVESIFSTALEKKTAAARAEYLDQACGDDAALRFRVERLLDAYPQAQDFMAQPAGERPSALEYADRNPELADQIRHLVPALVMVEKGLSIDPDRGAHGAQPPPVPSPIKEQRLGDYRILREIGRGGMGVVYEAEQVSLGRRVALKVLPGHASRDGRVRERFRREARAAARLHHTNIVPVYEVGQEEDVRFYAMQFIEGQGLDAVISELRRLLERARCRSHMEATSAGRSLRPRGRQPRQGFEAPTQSEEVEISAVLHYILTGRPNPTDRRPEPAGASSSLPSSALAGRSAAPRGTATESRAAGLDSALTSTETGSAATGDATGPQRAHSPARDMSPPASPSSSSAILPGGTQLSSVESGRRAFFRSLAQIGRQVAGGLAFAHARGIVHRDIKPSNLLLDTEGVVWIADFGLAKGEDEGLTQSGDILGTLRFMAPERFRGEGDARADVYALGLTLYELLTLRPGFDSTDRLKLIEQIKTEEPLKPRALDARIPRDLETIVLKAIEKEPKARYQSAEAMGEDLGRFLADEPIRARQVSEWERYWRWARRNPWIAALGAGLTAVLVLVTIGSLLAAQRFAQQARRERNLAMAEHSAREDANRQAQAELRARTEADQARAAAQAETYRAMLSEVRSLRAGHQPGWRADALANLARLAVMPTPRRDLPELRSEAAATLATPDIQLAARVGLPSPSLRSLVFSPDGRVLLTGDQVAGFDFWDVRDKSHMHSVAGLPVMITPTLRRDQVVYLSDGQGLAVASRDHGVVFTDTRGIRMPRAPITQGSSQPIDLRISKNGRRLAVAWTKNGGITVHDAASGDLVDRFKVSDRVFALSPDGNWLALRETADIVMRPIASGKPGIVLGGHETPTALAYSPDGALIAAAIADNTTVLWNVAKRERVGTFRGHRDNVYDVAFSADGEWIATGSVDYTARVWETRTGQNFATIPGLTSPIFRVNWSPTGDFLALGLNNASVVGLYQITGLYRVQRWLSGHPVELQCVASHPWLERLATAGAAELSVWDLSASHPAPVRLQTNAGQVNSLVYSPDGSRLAVATWDPRGNSNLHEITIRDADTGKVQGRITGPGIFRSLAFDPAGGRIASGDDPGNVVLWDLATSHAVLKVATGSTVYSIGFLDRPRRLVAKLEHSVLLFNLESGKEERKVDFAGVALSKLVIDRKRNRLVVGYHSGAIASLSLPDLTAGIRVESANEGQVWSLALSPDGRLLATGHDHRVVLRDAETFEVLLRLPAWDGTLRDLTFDCTGRRLAVVGTGSDVDVWDLEALRDGLTKVGLAWDRPAPVDAAAGLPPGGEDLRPAVPLIRRYSAARFERGNVLARRSEWKAALADFREGLARDPSETDPWMAAALLYLQLGDVEGYRRHARKMLDAFGTTDDPRTAEQTAKIGLLTAPPPDEATRLTALAELAVTKGAGSPLLPWFQLPRGMAAYREGQFALAVRYLSAAEESISNPLSKPAAGLFRAMAEARQGRVDTARALFDRTRRNINEVAPPAADLGPGWYDWLICQIALREAEAVIGQPPPPPVNPTGRGE
jgi:serine/threonine protein kinase/WD40 repeat protein